MTAFKVFARFAIVMNAKPQLSKKLVGGCLRMLRFLPRRTLPKIRSGLGRTPYGIVASVPSMSATAVD